jgi:uncharacterized membrane protein (UPF0127 family)
MLQVELSTSDWAASAYIARTFIDRLFGNLRTPRGSALVLRARSVHSFGQRNPIQIVGLDAGMRVVATRTLVPNRISVIPSARMILELPEGSPVPMVAERIEMTHG